MLFSTMTASVYIPTRVCSGSLFPTSSQHVLGSQLCSSGLFFVSVAYSFYSSTFIVHFQIMKYYSSRFILTSQDSLLLLGVMWLHINFRIYFSISVNVFILSAQTTLVQGVTLTNQIGRRFWVHLKHLCSFKLVSLLLVAIPGY